MRSTRSRPPRSARYRSARKTERSRRAKKGQSETYMRIAKTRENEREQGAPALRDVRYDTVLLGCGWKERGHEKLEKSKKYGDSVIDCIH